MLHAQFRTKNSLAARLEFAAVGDGDAEVLIRIDGSIVDANFVVKMRTGRATAQPDIADGIAAMNVLSRCSSESGEVAVTSRNAMAMVNHKELAVSSHEIGEGDHAIRWGDNRMAIAAADIDSTVKRALPVKRINTLAKAASDLTLDRPKVRSGISPVPISCGGIAGHS